MARRGAKCDRSDPENKHVIPCCGVIFTLIALVFAFVAERTYFNRVRAFREAMSYTELVDSEELSRGPAYDFESRLIHATGVLETAESLAVDPFFGFGVRSVRLRRTVETLQKCKSSGKGSSTHQCWKAAPSQDAVLFPALISSQTFTNPGVTFRPVPDDAEDTVPIGVDPELFASTDGWNDLSCSAPLVLTVQQYAKQHPSAFGAAELELVNRLTAMSNGQCRTSRDVLHPVIGDYAISFSYAISLPPLRGAAKREAAKHMLVPEVPIPGAAVAVKQNEHLISLVALLSTTRPASNRDGDGSGDGDRDARDSDSGRRYYLTPYVATSGHGEKIGFIYPKATSPEAIFRDRFDKNSREIWFARVMYALCMLYGTLSNWVEYESMTSASRAWAGRFMNRYLRVWPWPVASASIGWFLCWLMVGLASFDATHWAIAIMAGGLAVMPFVAHYSLEPKTYRVQHSVSPIDFIFPLAIDSNTAVDTAAADNSSSP